jgi:hypothetical protein
MQKRASGHSITSLVRASSVDRIATRKGCALLGQHTRASLGTDMSPFLGHRTLHQQHCE